MKKLANSSTDEAIRRTRELAAPPIERIRNDEAVFDYLIDGYRNTLVSSGAEYGGMVRRVLPFSFTFTPGSSSKSGFSARVLLKPDQKQIAEATEMIAPHLNAVMQDMATGYMQHWQEAERKILPELNRANESDSLLASVLFQDWNESCDGYRKGYDDTKDLILDGFYSKFEELFYKHDANGDPLELKNKDMKVPSFNQAMKAYARSLQVIRAAIENGSVSSSPAQEHQKITYNLDDAIKGIKKKIGDMNQFLKEDTRGIGESDHSVYELKDYGFSDQKRAVHSTSCQLHASIEKAVRKTQKSTPANNNDTDSFSLIHDINQLAMVMTTAGIAYDLRLKTNPLLINKGTISIKKDGMRYKALLPQINNEQLEDVAEKAAAPRIVQNTSREHVVEIPDTAKMNTFLSAALTGNEVSSQLGMTAGAELAAALSSSSAFLKRIPYAVPFTGQSLSLAKKACSDEQEKTVCSNNDKAKKPCICSYEKQSFGWKFYKTPSGVRQMGGIAQSFKTTVVNSAVVVSMPEWISKLEATYELSEDGGKTWRRAGQEEITLAGASLRGALNSGSSSFDTWVKYHLYREVDGEAGMPKLKSCTQENDSSYNIIHGNSRGYTALCGENLHGVKAVLVGGRYVDDGDIEKVSSSLIKLKVPNLGPYECSSSTCNSNSKCQVVLLSDFGAHNSDKPSCLQFSFSAPSDDVPLSLFVESEPPVITDNSGNKNVTIKLSAKAGATLDYYISPYDGKKESLTSKNPKQITLKKNDLIGICTEEKSEPCSIEIFGGIKVGGKAIEGLLYTVNMNRSTQDSSALGWWDTYPKSHPSVDQYPEKISGDNYRLYIKGVEDNETFRLAEVSINKQHTITDPNSNREGKLITPCCNKLQKRAW
ncbi:MAG: hypothetical protein SD837_21345 [Candidatus Electrothrix scaldis]|nr:MAG: hypothetical protein SD837_21345 [Candidatus Electrothrix sp. GW3-3]